MSFGIINILYFYLGSNCSRSSFYSYSWGKLKANCFVCLMCILVEGIWCNFHAATNAVKFIEK